MKHLWRGDRPPLTTSCRSCGNEMQTLSTHRSHFVCSLACRVALETQKAGDSECWEWLGVKDRAGYGECRFAKQKWRVHRAAYTLAKGKIPDGLVVMHSCDNPSCCNPNHLSVGTTQQNSDDKITKGRARAARGESAGHAKLTDEIVRTIRSSAESAPALAARFGVKDKCIYKVRQGIRWRHVS